MAVQSRLAGWQELVPLAPGALVVVEQADRGGEAGHGLQTGAGKAEIEDVHLALRHILAPPGLAMGHGAIAGAVAKMAPGGIGGAEAVEAAGVVEDGRRGHVMGFYVPGPAAASAGAPVRGAGRVKCPLCNMRQGMRPAARTGRLVHVRALFLTPR